MNEYQKIVDYALVLATEGHKGQTRWDKTPYIEHPRRVSKSVVQIFELNWGGEIDCERYHVNRALLAILGYAHDLNEDVETYRNDRGLFVRQLKAFDVDNIIGQQDYRTLETALEVLNKHNHPDYLTFVLKAKDNYLARLVKIADIQDNLSDLAKGSMREKYQLALHILKN